MVHDFDPCVDDELEVKRGMVVTVLYRENDWVYVIADKGREGFIPHSYCSLIENKPDIVAQNQINNNSTSINTISSSGSSKLQSQEDGSIVSSDIHPFYKVSEYIYMVNLHERFVCMMLLQITFLFPLGSGWPIYSFVQIHSQGRK